MILNEQQIDETPCDGDGCDLRACLVYASNLAPEEPWQSCLDCQRTDYGGWPEELKDVPTRVLPTGLRERAASFFWGPSLLVGEGPRPQLASSSS